MKLSFKATERAKCLKQIFKMQIPCAFKKCAWLFSINSWLKKGLKNTARAAWAWPVCTLLHCTAEFSWALHSLEPSVHSTENAYLLVSLLHVLSGCLGSASHQVSRLLIAVQAFCLGLITALALGWGALVLCRTADSCHGFSPRLGSQIYWSMAWVMDSNCSPASSNCDLGRVTSDSWSISWG